jgi:HrpA-like RNA helicase
MSKGVTHQRLTHQRLTPAHHTAHCTPHTTPHPAPLRLTKAVGVPLAELPLPPQLGAALLAAATRFGCCQELLTLAGMLSVPAVWASPGAWLRLLPRYWRAQSPACRQA